MRGSCLCGDVQFEIDMDSLGVTQCHCRLCRKQGGSASNTTTFVPVNKFRWLQGEGNVGKWRKATGFRSEFCRSCGSPVPNPLGDTDLIWIPVGLIDGDPDLKVVAHIYTDSKATWDPSVLAEPSFGEMPPFEELAALMHRP
ncbi:MAG: GFA family protein [Burkholderiaceae bacterium]